MRIKMFSIAAALLCALSLEAAEQAWLTDLTAAQALAKKENKAVLLDFTGSDWCSWCMKLKAEVFNTAEFKKFAAENLVLVEVDFPRRKKLPAAQAQANQQLAARYRIEGYPTIVILNANGQMAGVAGYMPGGAPAFIGELKKMRGM